MWRGGEANRSNGVNKRKINRKRQRDKDERKKRIGGGRRSYTDTVKKADDRKRGKEGEE